MVAAAVLNTGPVADTVLDVGVMVVVMLETDIVPAVVDVRVVTYMTNAISIEIIIKIDGHCHFFVTQKKDHTNFI